MNRSLFTALVAVAAVALLGLLLRRMSGGARDESVVPPPEPATADDEGDDEDEGDHEAVAVTSDGWAFVPDGGEVHLVPPAAPDPEFGVTGRGSPGVRLDAGDYVGARVVRGAPGVDPWRLEALGRDGEYVAFAFETEDAARAALELVERRIVQMPCDEDGAPRPPGEADYAAALQRTQEGVSDMAMDPEASTWSEDEPA